MSTPGSTIFEKWYEINPIILTGGIAENLWGGQMGIVQLTSGQVFDGVLSQGRQFNVNDFPKFIPISGAELVSQDVATYPFANQAVAANAVIANPQRISMMLIFPANSSVGYFARQATLLNLKDQLELHNGSGGTYTVATPAYIWTDCLMTSMRDASDGRTKQPQVMWQMDFMQPLLTEQQAKVSLNNAMNKITKATRWVENPAWSGRDPTVGLPPSLGGPSVMPSVGQAGSSSNTTSPASVFGLRSF